MGINYLEKKKKKKSNNIPIKLGSSPFHSAILPAKLLLLVGVGMDPLLDALSGLDEDDGLDSEGTNVCGEYESGDNVYPG